jgi:four helix bundle protein
MSFEQLKSRTRQFALDVVDLCCRLAADEFGRLVRRQLMRAATGVAANHRAACRCRSRREFISRLSVVIEEADESDLWLDLLDARACEPRDRVKVLRQEAYELCAIFVASRRTAMRKGRPGRKNGSKRP